MSYCTTPKIVLKIKKLFFDKTQDTSAVGAEDAGDAAASP